jgi:energy-coupling factor transporter ATP-binding protein EcfA2
LAEVFRRFRSLVILGNPGAGKTTLLRWLALVCSYGKSEIQSRLGLEERLFPIFSPIARLVTTRNRHPEDSPIELLARIFSADLPKTIRSSRRPSFIGPGRTKPSFSLMGLMSCRRPQTGKRQLN